MISIMSKKTHLIRIEMLEMYRLSLLRFYAIDHLLFTFQNLIHLIWHFDTMSEFKHKKLGLIGKICKTCKKDVTFEYEPKKLCNNY